MKNKVVRTIITVGIGVAVVAVLIVSSQHDSSNPHSTIPKDTWIHEKHAVAFRNASNPEKQCYKCHVKEGLGAQEYCQSCHEKSGVTVDLP